MKKVLRVLSISFLLACGPSLLVFAWGSWGHQHINNAAIFALPESMRVFFYNHKDFITEESVVPDLRKYTINDKAEFARHYIDLEDFALPLEKLPYTMKDAVAQYDDKTLQKSGILPWYMQDLMVKLTRAFKEQRKTEILFLAADLGHYVADANMPLHTSSNHDGQLTGQKGIHAFWESQLPEFFGANYNFYVPQAVYISDVNAEIWRIIKDSHQQKDSLLAIEKRLRDSYPPEKMFKTDEKGNVIKNKYGQTVRSREYAASYHSALGGMVEKQLKKSITDIANLWYTAWVNAGKPSLATLDPDGLTQRNRKNYKKDNKRFQKGKLFGFNTEAEF